MRCWNKLKHIKNILSNAIDEKLTSIQEIQLLFDYLWEHYVHGVLLIEYNQYRFYWKNKRERRTFVCHREFERIIEIANKKENFIYFDNKPLFNKTFEEYMGRDWLDTTKCSYDEFEKLLKKNQEVFVKPAEGMCGRGAYVYKTSEINDTYDYYEQLRKDHCIIEEVVKQHSSLAEFNDTSVNTLRIVTFLKANGDVEIMAAVLRLGRKGQVVDNFHNYGIVSLIDVETGIVKTTGVDREFKRYVNHPDSNKTIVGFKIPSWEEVVSVVIKSAQVVPTVRYVGWDISIGEHGEIIMIEGNKSADHDVTQVTDQVGKWKLYESLLKDLQGGK